MGVSQRHRAKRAKIRGRRGCMAGHKHGCGCRDHERDGARCLISRCGRRSRRRSLGAQTAALSPTRSRRKARQPRQRPDFARGRIAHRLERARIERRGYVAHRANDLSLRRRPANHSTSCPCLLCRDQSTESEPYASPESDTERDAAAPEPASVSWRAAGLQPILGPHREVINERDGSAH